MNAGSATPAARLSIAPPLVPIPTAGYQLAIGDAWSITPLAPGAAGCPESFRARMRGLPGSQTLRGVGPALTVAGALLTGGLLALGAGESPANGEWPDLDGNDWWFATDFDAPEVVVRDERARLSFAGLATVVDVWLNDVWLGESDNMFVAWLADVHGILRARNSLVLCARAMRPRLAPRRPRARWRARLLASQEWRWHRTTQLGRMPGFGPPLPPVGPWRPVSLEVPAILECELLRALPYVAEGAAHFEVKARLRVDAQVSVVHLECGAEQVPLTLRSVSGDLLVEGQLVSDTLQHWWPHTHGEPALHECALRIELADGSTHRIALGRFGFRSVRLNSSDGDFALSVNDMPIFMRGTCWTPRDWSRIDLDGPGLQDEFSMLRDAGFNCIRLSGCFVYPSVAFLQACDALGIMVWQDLMFSVLDYPASDSDFADACAREVMQVLTAVQGHACIVTVCGNAEVAQQAVMMGVEPGSLDHSLFCERFASIAAQAIPSVPYWPGTPWGGLLPFDVGQGTAHYFGVGAYRRPLSDARRSGVRFSTESLAFAHVPEPDDLMASGHGLAIDSPSWLERVPRDGGAAWTFEDVRDHYVGELFGVDAVALRQSDPARYLELGRAASVATAERTVAEFRRAESTCNGVLQWLWSDPWPGAGWGCIDSSGRPKSVWYGLRRSSQAVALAITDEGLSGANVHAWNDTALPVEGTLVVRLVRADGEVHMLRSVPLRLAARSSQTLSCDALLGQFTDIVHAYKFGAPTHELVHALWLAATETDALLPTSPATVPGTFGTRRIIGEAHLFPQGDARPVSSRGLSIDAVRRSGSDARGENEDVFEIDIAAKRTATYVTVRCEGFVASDSYLTLAPGVIRTISLRPFRAGVQTPSTFETVVMLRALDASDSASTKLCAATALVMSAS